MGQEHLEHNDIMMHFVLQREGSDQVGEAPFNNSQFAEPRFSSSGIPDFFEPAGGFGILTQAE